MPRRWERLRDYYDRARVEWEHIREGLERPRALKALETRDLHPEWREQEERLRQEIRALLDDPSTLPKVDHLQVRLRDQDFIDAVAEAAGLDRAEALWTIIAVFEVLKDRLPYTECAHLAKVLPPTVRRYIVKPKSFGVLHLSREEFVERVARHLKVDLREALRRIRAVYAVLEVGVGLVAPEEPKHLMARLPPELRKVLKAPPRAQA